MRKLILTLIFLCVAISSVSGAVSQWNTTEGSYTIWKFNGTGNISVTLPATPIDVLVVAGGGGGGAGYGGGGGGAGGGVVNQSGKVVSTSSPITISIGAGGIGVASSNGTNGNFSSFGDMVAIGGGGGGYGETASKMNGTPGGSGGGGPSDVTAGGGLGGAATQGNSDGGTGYGFAGGAGSGAAHSGGGGGGSSAIGVSASGGTGGNGGAGKVFYVYTTAGIAYAGGGGGGGESVAGLGGSGGGGNGVTGTATGVSATNGTGGGGGGAHNNRLKGGDGGNGVVIVRFLTPGPIIASFSQSQNPSNPGQVVTYTDTSQGSPITWSWTLAGTSPTNVTQNAAYTYTSNGVYTILLNVTNSTGSWSNTSQTHTVTNASGFTPQDIWMEGRYSETFRVTDSTTGLPIATVTLTDTAGTTNTTIAGMGILTEPFGATSITFVATGYTSRVISYFFDADATWDVQLTPTAATPSQSTWYTPWQVRIRIVDYYGIPLSNINVTANYIASSLPSTDTTWLVSAFGINTNVANDMLNSSVAMAGNTDDNGGLSFTMFKSIQYRLTITNTTLSVASTKTLYPSDQEYVIYVRTAGQTVANNTLAMRNGTLPWYSVNSSHINLNMTYVDTSLCTNQLVFRVWFRDNGTEVHNTTWSGFGAGYVYDNHTVPKAPIGTEYLWGYNATTVC